MDKKIGVINGLRGIALLGVFYQHLLVQLTPPGWMVFQLVGIKIFPFSILANGWLGVNLFFVLSGLVLFLPFEREMRER